MKTCTAFFRYSLMIFAVSSLVSCIKTNEQPETQNPKAVKSFIVQEHSGQESLSFPGIVEEANEVNLAFRVAGPIDAILVRRGEFVSKGQLLARLDARDYEIQKKATEAQAEQIRGEYQRIEELYKRHSISANDFEKARTGKKMIEAKLANVVDQLNDTRLYAPFDGYISDILYDDKELVNTGMPVLRMIDVSALNIEVDVPLEIITQLDRIQKIEARSTSFNNGNIWLKLMSANKKPGVQGLYKMYLTFPDSARDELIPGLPVDVLLELDRGKGGTFTVPASAIVNNGKELFVWKIYNGQTRKQSIRTGRTLPDGFVEITDGLIDGDTIVSAGAKLIHSGERVRVINRFSETNIGNLL